MSILPSSPRIAFVASDRPEALASRDALARRYASVPEDDADVIVALGGDGFMLEILHTHIAEHGFQIEEELEHENVT